MSILVRVHMHPTDHEIEAGYMLRIEVIYWYLIAACISIVL
jgi:hypothetical protein